MTRHRSIRIGLTIAAGAALPIGLVACGSGQRHDHPVVMVIADGSADAAPGTKTEARVVLRAAIDDAAPREGTALADVVQADAQSTLSFPFLVRFQPKPGTPDNAALVQDDLAAEAAAAGKKVPSAFRRPRAASGSDLVGGFIDAGERLSQPDLAKRPQTLVMVSNMLNNTPGFRFTHVVLTPQRIQRMLATLRRQGRIARLRGVSVAVAGGGLVQPPLSSAQQQGLRVFWRRYLDASGAKLVTWVPRMDEIPGF